MDEFDEKSKDNILFEFTNTFDVNNLRCIEIEDYMLDELLNEKLEIRGLEDDEAMLVSSKNTYRMKKAEFSNEQFVYSDNNISSNNTNEIDKENILYELNERDKKTKKIHAMINCVYTLTKCKPRLNVLYTLLSLNPYKIKGNKALEEEEDIEMKDTNSQENEMIDTSFESLKSKIQASDKELLQGLKDINAICINGQWKLLDNECLIDCFSDILSIILSFNLKYDKIDLNTIIEKMANKYPNTIIKHCLKIHSLSNNNDTIFSLDERLVCLFTAKQILYESQYNYMENQLFFQELDTRIPYGMKYNESYFKGELILIERNNNLCWELLSQKELSPEPNHRFEQLFYHKEKWKKEELEPYILSLCNLNKKLTIDKILSKYTKKMRIKDKNGKIIEYFQSRKIKRRR